MRMNKILLTLLGAALLCMATLTGKGENLVVDSWFTVPTLFGGTARVSLDGSSFYTVNAGELRATTDTGVQWTTFCTDLGISLSSGSFTPLSLSVAQGLPAWQTPDWAPGGVQRAAEVYFAFRDEVENAADAVALQTLIWENLYDTEPSLTAGRFQLSASGTTHGAYGQAMSWIHEHEGPEDVSSSAIWWGPTTALGDYRPGQGLLGNAQVIPEPSAGSLLIVALPLFGMLYFRNRPSR